MDADHPSKGVLFPRRITAGAGKVFREVASGAKTDRIQLRKVIAMLGAGDALMVTRLDRLARSTRDLLNTLAAIADRKAGFRSLSDAWAARPSSPHTSGVRRSGAATAAPRRWRTSPAATTSARRRFRDSGHEYVIGQCFEPIGSEPCRRWAAFPCFGDVRRQ